MLGDSQKQTSGDNSVNIQGRDVTVIHGGISYQDARQIALDVFHANFVQLRAEAAAIVEERAQSFIDVYLDKQIKQNPDALGAMTDPDLQLAIFQAQKEYARFGTEELQGVLVDLLIKRAGESGRNTRQIVLNESLTIASKLTQAQLDTLSIAFLIRQTKDVTVNNLESFSKYIKAQIVPFIPTICLAASDYQHIQFTGCASTNSLITVDLLEVFKNRYSAFFSKGFTLEGLNLALGGEAIPADLVIPAFHNKKLLQFAYLKVEDLEESLDKARITEPRERLRHLFTSTMMNNQEAKAYFESIDPEIPNLLNYWEKTQIQKLELSSVGIALAQANIERATGQKFDLSIWIK